MPSSTSTSTSQMWVPKPPSAPSVLSCTPAPIGPPICGAFAASSASVSGSNWPALGLAGCAAPFSHFTASGSISQIFAARSRKVAMIFSVDCVTTIAEANSTRLPPVRFEKPTVAVSPIRTETRR